MIGASGWVYVGLKAGGKAVVLNFFPQFFIVIPGLFSFITLDKATAASSREI